MGAYNNLDPAIAGLILGINGRKQIDTFVAQEQIEFGDPVMGYEGEDNKGYNVKQDKATITLDADLVTSNVITTTITIDGVAQSAIATTFDTSHDNTMDLHEAAIEAAISGIAVTLTDGTNNRQFTLLHKGHNINLITSVVTLGASQAGVTIAYTNGQVFLGIAGFEHTSFNDSRGSYFQYDPMNVMTYGKIWVNSSIAVNAHVDAYVIWQITNQKKFTSVSTNNYDVKCKFRSTNTAAGLVLLEVRGQQLDSTP